MEFTDLFRKIDSSSNPESAQDRMIAEQIQARGINEPRLIEAMRAVPRDRFVPAVYRSQAFEDGAVTLGSGQTVSQPYIVGLMTRLLRVSDKDKVLEIGTGSGYQTAILARLAKAVYSVERLPALGSRARETLDSLGYTNVHYRIGDGHLGWPEASPFDGIMVTAAPNTLPNGLFRQLSPGGRMVIPIGEDLYSITRSGDQPVTEYHGGVRFVPMVEGGGPSE